MPAPVLPSPSRHACIPWSCLQVVRLCITGPSSQNKVAPSRQIPHYHLTEATEAVKPVLGEYYRDPEPSPGWWPSHLWEPLKRRCVHNELGSCACVCVFGVHCLGRGGWGASGAAHWSSRVAPCSPARFLSAQVPRWPSTAHRTSPVTQPPTSPPLPQLQRGPLRGR